jgi:hypothetical protein
VAQRAEERGDREGRSDDGQLRLASREGAPGELKGDHAGSVHHGEGDGQAAVDEGAVDDQVDVVEAVAQDGDAGGDGNGGDEQRVENREQVRERILDRGVDEEPDGQDGGGVGEPLELLSFLAHRTEEANDEAPRRREDQGYIPNQHDDLERFHEGPQRFDPQRVLDA